MNINFRKYIIFWISQSVSQLGSAMTSFALILWTYEQTNSAMAVSIMAFCNYLPYIAVSLFAGAFVDRHSKKKIMIVSDAAAAVCSLTVFLLSSYDLLQIWHIYVVNGIIGFMNAVQSPALSVATEKMVPKGKMAQVSGMNSFSTNLITVLTPVIAAALFGLGDLKIILGVDLFSFTVAFFILLFYIHIPEKEADRKHHETALAGCKTGFRFLLENKGLLAIIVTIAVLNFFSRLTYENILSPMILSRSGNNNATLAMVNAALGIGGIVGGILVSSGKLARNHIKMIYVSAAISFLFGDVLMGLGRNTAAWCVAGLAASVPIPFIIAGQNVILYKKIPSEMQGRVFAVRNAIQFSTIPIGILLGGFLADYVFEPFMQSESNLANGLSYLVGNSSGSGMAVMFLCTGICGSAFSLFFYKRRIMRDLQ
ncbi:MFS transporter [Konateibacter massiliensis]|uniref:MFS transporter n=1 Tax=Konateibacter massiliensis TaxID=2002841 RepID=UPI000C161074|nr:MFS transporter [Konateibacter massiliensis]